MIDYKPWYQSKGVIGSIVSLLAVVAGLFGIDLTGDDQSTLTLAATQVVAGAGAIIALIGRLVAKSKIG